jgi:hypothetical protein
MILRSNQINFWGVGQIPYSWNPKNKTLLWSGLDNQYNADPNWNQGDINYKYNNQGFRTHDLLELDGQTVDIALGCSFTEGIGLPVDCVWPSLIEQQTNLPMLNLGLGGGSTDTVARVLTNVCSLYKINTVYILWPSINRFENTQHNNINRVLPQNAKPEYVWFLDEENSAQRFYKNQILVRQLSKVYNFDIKERNILDDWQILGDQARDQAHAGVLSHQNLAKIFLTEKE